MPDFLDALKQATEKYMKVTVTDAVSRAYKRLVRRYISHTISGIHFNGPVRSDFETGAVFGRFTSISNDISKLIRDRNEEFMKDVFELSQRYVPIDKKYAKSHNVKYLKRRLSKSILSLPSKTTKGSKNNKPFVDITREHGWYDSSEIDFINDMLRSSNHRKISNRVFYNPDTGTINVRRKRTDDMFDTGFKLKNKPIKDITKLSRTNIQPTGGYQELKNGGELRFGRGYSNIYITYSAFDKTRQLKTFNYAALQHDNLAFKHMSGKKPLFLYKAFDKCIKKWIKDIGAKPAK